MTMGDGLRKLGWGALYGAVGGVGTVVADSLHFFPNTDPVMQSILGIGITAAGAGIAKLLKFLAAKRDR